MPTLLLRPAHTHPDTPAEPATSTELRRILVPLDGSKLAEQVLELARELSELFGTEYWLLRVVEPFQYDGYVPPRDAPTLEPDQIHVLDNEAHTYLRDVAAEMRCEGCVVEARVVQAHRAAPAILDAAEYYDSDLIALATHGRGGLRRVLLGSVADTVVRGAACPVLVLRPRQPATTDAAGARECLSAPVRPTT